MAKRRTHEKAARTRMVCVRMTDDDYARQTARARALGLTVSGLCERLVLEGKVDIPAQPVYRPMDPMLFHELRRIGNNVNQIAHCMNGNLLPDLDSAWNTVKKLLSTLMAEELFAQKSQHLRTRTVANDPTYPQARDVFQRRVRIHPSRFEGDDG